MPKWGDLAGLAARSFLKGLSGKTPAQVMQEERARRRQEQTVISLATLQAFLAQEQARYNEIVRAQRAQGSTGYPNVELEVSQLGGQLAVTRYNINGDTRRIDIFYGGAGANPLTAPDHDYHGHIVIVGNDITSCWNRARRIVGTGCIAARVGMGLRNSPFQRVNELQRDNKADGIFYLQTQKPTRLICRQSCVASRAFSADIAGRPRGALLLYARYPGR